ncbi:hypothetical protein [Kyrpidia tusciae]|uniref:Uncharacterized protein n=1 Tax=Kyrpidia tusciae (strain DSM 2912 / NBRC 15312 / T2) TaxID=562970 RepID=D5WVL5_KYRT2|nr:hypothetical protein [Kyrpidia tusciae]ADG07558.1 hypothetical protein Btus_2922 [Kyrpidia tusciae DSM 2912]
MAVTKEELHRLIDQITDPADLEIAYEALRAVVESDQDQSWFWTEYWQAGEREADEDKASGRISGPFGTADEAVRHLDRAAAKGGNDED